MPRLRAAVFVFMLLASTATASPAFLLQPSRNADMVLVIAHRGASALLPEHTLAAYAKAIADGADVIEPDLVATREGVLIARHENEIGTTTDVASHPGFADRRTRRRIDGRDVEGWFTEDFTLAELRTLRVRERLPELRGKQYDGRYVIPTLAEIIDLVAEESARSGRLVGLAPELKHSTYFRGIDLPLEDALLTALAAHAHTRRAPVLIQSFEVGNLRYLRKRLGEGPSNIRLVQLVGSPADAPPGHATDGKTPARYADMTTPRGLRQIADYAHAIGAPTRSVIPVEVNGSLGQPTALVPDARAAGLQVLAYTFRPENHFLPRALWKGDDPRARNEAGSIAEIRAYVDAGIDGFFTDDPALGRKALEAR